MFWSGQSGPASPPARQTKSNGNYVQSDENMLNGHLMESIGWSQCFQASAIKEENAENGFVRPTLVNDRIHIARLLSDFMGRLFFVPKFLHRIWLKKKGQERK